MRKDEHLSFDDKIKKIVIKEPSARELKKFQRKVVESLEMTTLRAEVENLKKQLKEARDKIKHLDKLPKEEYIALMKELKAMRNQELFDGLEKQNTELKRLLGIEKRNYKDLLTIKLQLEIKLKER